LINKNKNNEYNVSLKGSIHKLYDVLFPIEFISKKVYLILNNDNKFPNNLTTISYGNLFIGTVINQNSLLVGL